jgi:hypothetical protein
VNRKPEGEQLETVSAEAPYIQESFDLNRMDAFVKSLGTLLTHWKAVPSPIGLNEKGDYRRNSGQVDVMTSNGYIYSLAGTFIGVMTGNDREQRRPTEGGLLDSAQSHLVLPRYYEKPHRGTPAGHEGCQVGEFKNERIYLTPGDRLYYGDPQADDLVVNKELMNFEIDKDTVPMYPIIRMDAPIMDSRGVMYQQNIDFIITDFGDIRWLEGRPNPGIDPDTGEGRTFSARYLYKAFYYVTAILREVRITNTSKFGEPSCDNNGLRSAERMPMFVQLTREYLYHNINNGGETNKAPQKGAEIRQTVEPSHVVPIKTGIVRVETTDISEDT